VQNDESTLVPTGARTGDLVLVAPALLRRDDGFASNRFGHASSQLVTAACLRVTIRTDGLRGRFRRAGFDFGFNVEASDDHPVWHESGVDVFPGQK
jgi:hypothetical protein